MPFIMSSNFKTGDNEDEDIDTDSNGVSSQMVDLVARLVDLIPWPIRRSAMGDVAISLLDGKPGPRMCLVGIELP